MKLNEIDFDSWDDYKPTSSEDVIITSKKIEESNPNLLKLKINDQFETIVFTKEDFINDFDNYSEKDYTDEEFIRFIKEEEKNDIQIFHCPKHEDVFLLIKDNKKYVLYSYQNSGYYFNKGTLTFTGWDDNIAIDIKNLSSKRFNVR